jgi:hypothetical protein
MSGMANDVIEQQFTVDARPELSISNISGRIDIRAGDSSTISMRATKHGSREAVANTRIEFRHDGNRVRVETKGERSGLLNLSRNVSAVDYQLVVPRDCEVRAQAVSAGVRVEGLSAAVSAQTVSGDVELAGIAGDCQVTTVSGAATGRRLTGALTLRTTSGDTDIRDSALRHFNLNSVSGDFAIESPLSVGQHYLAKTVSGDLRLLVPADVRATVQMKSVSGEVASDLQAEVIKAGRRHWQGRINGGGATVEMNSVSGDLRIQYADGAPQGAMPPSTSVATPEVAPEVSQEASAVSSELPISEPPVEDGPETPADTGAVLRALERGEITVEEAMQRLGGPESRFG